MIRALLQARARIDARNNDKATPLLLAAIAGHQPAAILLAGKGADVEVSRPAAQPLAGGHTLVPSVRCSGCWLGGTCTSQVQRLFPPEPASRRVPFPPQAEDAEGETPLGAAAKHGKLREALVAVVKGEMTLDDFMLE